MVLLFPDISTNIDLDKQSVVIDGSEYKVRPKTFQLLQALIEANGELVSKQTLLDTVWDDVIVDEQVIFQSIKELRKLFPGQTVIKTVPRKGYAWLPKAQIEAQVPPQQKIDAPIGRNKSLILALISIALIVFLSFDNYVWQPQTTNTLSGSVVVLPVHSDIAAKDYDWVRYGIMDQVIARLQSTQQAGVLQTDYVLDVMTRAKVSLADVAQGRIETIFDVSGAELIVAMQLTGSPKDYQLVYRLYQRDSVEKGAVLDDSIQDAADQLAELVGRRLKPDFVLSEQAYDSSFTERMIAEALELKSAGNADRAMQILHAASAAAPDNLVAARLLVQSLVESGSPHSQVSYIAEPAIAKAEQANSVVDQIRLGFWLAVSETMKADTQRGLARFNQVERLAASVNDWLYLAYVEEIRGRVQQGQQDYTSANEHFNQAMQYHQILHCPLGQSNTLMHLSRLAKDEQKTDLAIARAQQALDLIKTRSLSSKLTAAEEWMVQLKTLPTATP